MSVRLTGHVGTWDHKVTAGYAAAGCGFKGVINDISVEGYPESPMRYPRRMDSTLQRMQYDVAIIGAGVIGCAIARELTRYALSVAVLEKEEDVGVHASSRNDGMIHPGMAPEPGSLKALYNVRGNRMYESVSRELGFAFKRVGSLLLFDSRWKQILVPLIHRRCRQNGVDGEFRYVPPRQVSTLEPNVTPLQRGAFLLPSTGVVSPFEVTTAYAENAAVNGASFFFETVVSGMDITQNESGTDATGNGSKRITRIRTNRGIIEVKAVVNAAGAWADGVAEMAGDRFFSIHGRRGVDLILDKRVGTTQSRILSLLTVLGRSGSHSKGGGLIPTVDGNLLAGPTASETPRREDYSTSEQELEELDRHLGLNTMTRRSDIITYFAGVRAATWEEDFIIERSSRVSNLIHAAGIQSPGLASAPAIASDVADMVAEVLSATRKPVPNPRFDPIRPPRMRPGHLPLHERAKIIERDRAHGRIICRCEQVSEGEIRDALKAPLEPRSLDAIKRRTRAMAGRCHSGFCLPRVMETISKETGIPMCALEKKGEGSFLAVGETKDPSEGSNAKSSM